MPKQNDGYKVVPFSEGRQIVSAVNELGEKKHLIHGLVEVDVTMVRQFIREYEAATGTDISFTAYIVTCLGKAVSMNERVNAYRLGGSQLVLFDDVDINIAIEREVNGEKVPLTYIFRAAHKKEYHDIVDGAPAARFTSQLISQIESGYGFVEQEAATE